MIYTHQYTLCTIFVNLASAINLTTDAKFQQKKNPLIIGPY